MRSQKWYKRHKRAYLLDFQMPDSKDQEILGQKPNLQKIDVKKIVDKLNEAQVKAVYVHAKDNQGNCYYNTEYGHKHSEIGDRDLMTEFVEELHARDMEALFYVSLSCERRSSLHELHQAKDAEGNPVIITREKAMLPSSENREVVCLNGPHREYIINIVKEITTNYDLDGFWFDNFGFWGRTIPCFCSFCQAKYMEETGRELPDPEDRNSPAFKKYLIWRRNLNTVILKEILNTVKEIKPEITITHNGSAQGIQYDNYFCDIDDYLSHEFHYSEGHGNLSFTSEQVKSSKPGEVFEREVWRFFNRHNEMSRAYQIRSIPALLTEMYAILAHGGFVQYYDQINPDGTLDERSLEVLKVCFDHIKEIEPWLDAGRELPYAGIVWSKATEGYCHSSGRKLHQSSMEGTYYSLLEDHIPTHIITDRTLAEGKIDQYKTILLPAVTCLSEKEIENLKRFVADGGGLVVTYRSSMMDENGKLRLDFGLSELIGANYLEISTYLYSFIQADEEHDITGRIAKDWPMSIYELSQVKSKTNTATPLGHIVNPRRGFPMGHPPAEDTPFPSILINEYGKGRVVYLSAPLGAAYYEYGHPDFKYIIADAVKWAAGEKPEIEAEAPTTVEVIPREVSEKNEYRIHILNRTPAGPTRATASVIQEVIPVRDIKIKISGDRKPVKAILQPEGQKLKIENEDDEYYVIVPEVSIYKMLVIEC